MTSSLVIITKHNFLSNKLHETLHILLLNNKT